MSTHIIIGIWFYTLRNYWSCGSQSYKQLQSCQECWAIWQFCDNGNLFLYHDAGRVKALVFLRVWRLFLHIHVRAIKTISNWAFIYEVAPNTTSWELSRHGTFWITVHLYLWHVLAKWVTMRNLSIFTYFTYQTVHLTSFNFIGSLLKFCDLSPNLANKPLFFNDSDRDLIFIGLQWCH